MTDNYDLVLEAVEALQREGSLVTERALGLRLGCSACSTRKYLKWAIQEGLVNACRVTIPVPGYSPTDPQRQFMEVDAYTRTEKALA